MSRRQNLTPEVALTVAGRLESGERRCDIARAMNLSEDQVASVKKKLGMVREQPLVRHTWGGQLISRWADRERKPCPAPPVSEAASFAGISKARLMAGK